jgi:circadian clock protein KaiB
MPDDGEMKERDGRRMLLRLYIADNTQPSVKAMANLEAIRRNHLYGYADIEIVDILEDPIRTLVEGVLVTPTLVRLSPLPARRIVGDLSDTLEVLQALEATGGPE